MSALNACVGFNCDYLSALKQRADILNDKVKFVVVTFDVMSLKSALKYDEKKDKSMGCVDYG